MREATYRFGDVEVDVGGRELRRGGVRVALEPKALDVLLLLLAEPGRVVEKRRLLGAVWAGVHVTDSSLARAITQVRRAVGDEIRTPRYIETVPTRGYRFIGTLRPPDEHACDRVDAVPSTRADDVAGGWDSPRLPSASGPRPAAPDSPRLPSAHDPRRAAPDGPRLPSASHWRARVWAAIVVVVLGLIAVRVAWQGGVSQAAPADLGALLVGAATHGAVQVTTSRGLDVDPAIAPDGSAIAYASDASGALEIFIRPRIASSATRAVTANGGDNVSPAWSPDGQWLAYHSRRLGGIWVVPAAGGPTRQVVAEGASPSWSADGQWIVFQTAGEADILGGAGGSASTLRMLRVSTGEVTDLTHRGDPPGSHGSAVWIPGHDGIVFVAARVPSAEVWQVTRAGRLTRLGSCHASCRPFAFARDGVSWVGAVRGAKDGELWLAPVGRDGLVDMGRASMTRLPRAMSVTDISVSHDGRQMAFTNAERTSEAWALDLPGGAADGRAPRVLLGERRPRYGEFAVSSDGTRLAYTTSRLGDRPEPWMYDLASGTSRPLGLAVGGYVKGWEPDGHAVAVIGPDDVRTIKRLDLATGRATRLIGLERWQGLSDLSRRLFTLRLSPDWRRYFYTAEEHGETGVWMADVNGASSDRRVARNASFGAWSADGQRLALQVGRGWRSSVGIVSPGSPDVTLMVTDADHAWPNSWSPDNRRVVYAALRQGRWSLEAVDVETRQVQRLTTPGAASEYVRWPVWSPRGDLIVYERGYWTGNVWVAPVGGT